MLLRSIERYGREVIPRMGRRLAGSGIAASGMYPPLSAEAEVGGRWFLTSA
jgi:hypothetical protein